MLAFQEILNLICIAILYSIISLMSGFGIIFVIFLRYVRNTYALAKKTRLQLQKEEIQLVNISEKIAQCSSSVEKIPGLLKSHHNAPEQCLCTSNKNKEI